MKQQTKKSAVAFLTIAAMTFTANGIVISSQGSDEVKVGFYKYFLVPEEDENSKQEVSLPEEYKDKKKKKVKK